jgi:hypothetical protein
MMNRADDVDPRWSEFKAFLEDMGKPPTESHWLMRLDRNKPYNKENMTWKKTEKSLRSAAQTAL